MVPRILASLLFGFTVLAGAATAQEKYPSKPIRLVVPFAVGGPTDIIGRIIGAKLSDLLGQQIVVDNRPGAGSNIGADLVAKSAPDGYTLLLGSVSAFAINPGLYKNMPYDPVRDFEPIGQIGEQPVVLVVNSALPATDLKSLIALVKANPGKYSYGSPGVGAMPHLCGEVLKAMGGNLDIVHVPYRGSGPMMNDLSAGQITMAFDGLPTVLPQIQAGTIRAIGAGTATRTRSLPDLPSLDEQGFRGFECYTWNAIFAPAKTPPRIVAQLNTAINAALADKAVFTRLQDIGIDPTPDTTPEKLAAFVKAQLAKWAPVIKASGTQLD